MKRFENFFIIAGIMILPAVYTASAFGQPLIDSYNNEKNTNSATVQEAAVTKQSDLPEENTAAVKNTDDAEEKEAVLSKNATRGPKEPKKRIFSSERQGPGDVFKPRYLKRPSGKGFFSGLKNIPKKQNDKDAEDEATIEI